MKLLAFVVLAACQSKSPPPAPPPPAPGSATLPAAPPPIAHGADICHDTLALLERATCGSNDDGLRAARTSVEGIINTMTKVGGGDPSSYDIVCGRLLLALQQDLAKTGCTLTIDAPLRDRVTSTLDAFYNQRTPVTKTGDAASDDVIAKIAAIRDATCDCRTGACLDKLDPQAAALPTLPATAPDAARALGTKLLDDAARCAQRARMNP